MTEIKDINCLRKSRLRALLFGSRPGGGFPRPVTAPPAGPLAQLMLPHDPGLPDGPSSEFPLGKRLSGSGESGYRSGIRVGSGNA